MNDLANDIADLENKAKNGCSESMNELGAYFYAKKDYVAARDWFAKAASKGELTAFSNLGVLYERGLSVENNYHIAQALYQYAVDKGCENAQENLFHLNKKIICSAKAALQIPYTEPFADVIVGVIRANLLIQSSGPVQPGEFGFLSGFLSNRSFT